MKSDNVHVRKSLAWKNSLDIGLSPRRLAIFSCVKPEVSSYIAEYYYFHFPVSSCRLVTSMNQSEFVFK